MKNLIFLLLLSTTLLAQENNSESDSEVIKFIKKSTDIKEPWKLRNPFVVKLRKTKIKNKEVKRQEIGGGELISEIKVEELQIVGVLAGKKKRAFAKFNNKVVVLKEGDKIGPDKVELKAILPGGVVIVDRFVNVYGQEEYLETIIPIGATGETSGEIVSPK